MNNNYQEEALMKKKMTFALCFCNRGFMPGELIYGARDDMEIGRASCRERV